MDARQQRGLLLALAKRVQSDGRVWLVRSQTGSGVYVVKPDAGTCTCPDFEARQLPCKHAFAVRYVRGQLPTPDEIKTRIPKPTYTQPNWPAYHAAQCEEKSVVLRLLREMCGTIVQPPYRGRGRPPLSVADLVFAMVLKVYVGMSMRRSMTDIGEGLNGKAPSHNAILAAMQREDLTPLLTSMVEASAIPLAAIEHDFSIDATGFAVSPL